MGLEATHFLLVKGESLADCAAHATHFFEKNFLVRYDRIEVLREKCCSAESNGFWDLAEEKIRENRQAVANLVDELQECGFREISDLNQMNQGYESKVLHIITHLLDGFFGADTVFYNLEEDSHWLSEKLAGNIREQPENFWLLHVKCSTETTGDRFNQIRKFEVKPES